MAKVVLQFAGGVVHHGNSVPAQKFHVSALGILPRQQRRSYTNPKRERGIRRVSLAGASG